MSNSKNSSLIRIRDPFILSVCSEQMYYLFGTTDSDPWFGRGEGFLVYNSTDLINWYGPRCAFTPTSDFWADTNYWAPEVYSYGRAYYMIASFRTEGKRRGVQILKAELPSGPYTPITEGPITPENWDCLDGTLYVENGTPWLVFSHEWTQIGDGAICCAALSVDLKKMISEPKLLFNASEAKWSVPETGDVVKKSGENYVTDGPFVYKAESGKLNMMWSSYSKYGYSIGIATSTSGSVTGPWIQMREPFFHEDGGHGMLFKTFEGKSKLAIHAPNVTPSERLCLIDVVEDDVLGLRIQN